MSREIIEEYDHALGDMDMTFVFAMYWDTFIMLDRLYHTMLGIYHVLGYIYHVHVDLGHVLNDSIMSTGTCIMHW
jgi:hypothetical protein